jgi:hypothetical protein
MIVNAHWITHTGAASSLLSTNVAKTMGVAVPDVWITFLYYLHNNIYAGAAQNLLSMNIAKTMGVAVPDVWITWALGVRWSHTHTHTHAHTHTHTLVSLKS